MKQTNINALAGQNFFSNQLSQLISELAKLKIDFKIDTIKAETKELKAVITLAQAETTKNTHQTFTIKAWLYNKDNEEHATFRIVLEHNKGVADYPRTKEQIHAWAKQFNRLEYDFAVNSHDLKMGFTYLRNDNTGNFNLYTHEAVSKIVELAKTLQTAKE
jgi:hypothetical protein